jgi:predicted nuclease of predicted toxin-antitoxin system
VKLLLDNHIPRAVAEGLRRADIDALASPEWRGGGFREAEDELILARAAEDGLVFVAYDRRTVPSLLTRWSAGFRQMPACSWSTRRRSGRGIAAR